MIDHRQIASTLLAGLLLLVGGDANALASFDLTLTGPNWDRPIFGVTNTSTAGEALTDLSISIGDTFYNFDFIEGVHPSEATTGATLLSPNRANNDWWVIGGESNSVLWSFTGFDAGETFVFAVDIDHDLALFGSTADARLVLMNNDFFFLTNPNAIVSATFSDGSVALITLPDGPLAGAYAFSSGSASGGSGSVPEPTVLALLGLGLVGLGWIGEPRRPAAP